MLSSTARLPSHLDPKPAAAAILRSMAAGVLHAAPIVTCKAAEACLTEAWNRWAGPACSLPRACEGGTPEPPHQPIQAGPWHRDSRHPVSGRRHLHLLPGQMTAVAMATPMGWRTSCEMLTLRLCIMHGAGCCRGSSEAAALMQSRQGRAYVPSKFFHLLLSCTDMHQAHGRAPRYSTPYILDMCKKALATRLSMSTQLELAGPRRGMTLYSRVNS